MDNNTDRNIVGEHDQTAISRSQLETVSRRISKVKVGQGFVEYIVGCALCFCAYGGAIFELPCKRKVCEHCFQQARQYPGLPVFACVCGSTHDSVIFAEIRQDRHSLEHRISDALKLKNNNKCPSLSFRCPSCDTELRGRSTIAGFCIMCGLLCEWCYLKHQEDRLLFPLPRHTSITSEQLLNGDVDSLPVFCPNHDQVKRFYCDQCQHLKCSACVTECVASDHYLQENIQFVLQDIHARQRLQHFQYNLPRVQDRLCTTIQVYRYDFKLQWDLRKTYNNISFLMEEVDKVLEFGSTSDILERVDWIDKYAKSAFAA